MWWQTVSTTKAKVVSTLFVDPNLMHRNDRNKLFDYFMLSKVFILNGREQKIRTDFEDWFRKLNLEKSKVKSFIESVFECMGRFTRL